MPTLRTYKMVIATELKAHIFLPADPVKGELRPVIILLHGGGWNVGAPEWMYDDANCNADQAWLPSQGIMACPVAAAHLSDMLPHRPLGIRARSSAFFFAGKSRLSRNGTAPGPRNVSAFVPDIVLLTAFVIACCAPPRVVGQNAARVASPPGQAPAASTATPGSAAVTVEQNVTYATVNGVALRLDVYQPVRRDNALRPAVMLIHGGGWTSFDKSTMRGIGEYLARGGFVAFSVDYRLFDGAQNRWPAQLDDVQRAVRWVRANAASYGVNAERIGAFGHSAGAQLAALLGMEETRDNSDPALAKYSSRVQAVVDVSGPADFTLETDPEGAAFLEAFLGVAYVAHPEVWREASPAFHVSKDDAPFLIFHGTHDEDVPLAQAQELHDRLAAAGVSVSFFKVDDVHTFRTPAARLRLAIETQKFFREFLAASP
ncbi:MAG TPA: alpha/beta hydrolase fold domain-containing protein [Acidisarcina sp.]